MIEPATKKDLAKLKTDLIRTLVTWQLINVAMSWHLRADCPLPAVLDNAHDRANSPSPITRAVRNIRARASQWQGYPDSRAPLGRDH